MQNVILIVHVLACIAMTGVIMLQRSEGGALGIGGGGGGLMTGRGAAGALVRVTMILGGIFFVTSLSLTVIANLDREEGAIIDTLETEEDGGARTIDEIANEGLDSIISPEDSIPADNPDAGIIPGIEVEDLETADPQSIPEGNPD